MKIRTFRIGGIHPAENKLSNDAATQPAPLPKQEIGRASCRERV